MTDYLHKTIIEMNLITSHYQNELEKFFAMYNTKPKKFCFKETSKLNDMNEYEVTYSIIVVIKNNLTIIGKGNSFKEAHKVVLLEYSRMIADFKKAA